MELFSLPAILLAALPLVGTVCQITTALIAAAIGIVTFRYTQRQNALTLINHNNALANAVNATIIASPDARAALGRLQDTIVGAPDDAVLFMYLNYVHNTFRMRQIGAVGAQVWQDTLTAGVDTLGKLSRDQVVRLLGRGYEPKFRTLVLGRFDAVKQAGGHAVVKLVREPAPDMPRAA